MTKLLSLVGAWEGSLRWLDKHNVDFRVFLVIAKCSKRALKGILYYEGFDINENKLVYRGADRLEEDDLIEFNQKKDTCKLIFQRKAHEFRADGDTGESTSNYDIFR